VSEIIVALDFSTIEEARSMAELVGSEVAGFKVGLELITGVGPQAISLIAALEKPVFADVKLHDIPNTVGGAARRIAAAGARWVTVHAAGGREMMKAAVEGMGGAGVLAVSVLTSFDERDLDATGIESGLGEQVVRLARLADEAGRFLGVELAHGIYAAVRGPSYETPAEVRWLRAAGADAVGMSTAPEAVAARHLGMEVLAIACITNMAAGVTAEPPDHAAVLETAGRARGTFDRLVEEILARI